MYNLHVYFYGKYKVNKRIFIVIYNTTLVPKRLKAAVKVFFKEVVLLFYFTFNFR